MIKIGVKIKKYKDQLGAFVTKKIKKGSIIFIYIVLTSAIITALA